MNHDPASLSPIRPLDAIMLAVGDGHWIYVEEVGTRGGAPALFLHGGPGSGAQPSHRRLFDPGRHHAILIDQRGAGRSHPYLGLHANSTRHLVDDIEAVRRHFGFDRMIIVGGSWGSTLALAYAESHPDRVAGLVLRAVFLGTDAEVQWAFVEGPRRFRPELYANFVEWLPKAERNDPVGAYVSRLVDRDHPEHVRAAHIWNAYERVLSELVPPPGTHGRLLSFSGPLPPTPIVEAHYIRNHFFFEPGALLAGASRLTGIPGAIVQGRYDLLCPPEHAYALAQSWGTCRLELVEGAGHAMTEPGIEAAMIAAIRELTPEHV